MMHLAKDLVQETFLRAWKALDKSERLQGRKELVDHDIAS